MEEIKFVNVDKFEIEHIKIEHIEDVEEEEEEEENRNEEITEGDRPVCDVEPMYQTGKVSEHRIVRTRISINTRWERQKRIKQKKVRVDTKTLLAKREPYQQALETINQVNRKKVQSETNVSKMERKFHKMIMDATEKVKKERNTGKENSKEKDDLLARRRQMLMEGKRCTVEFTELNKAIKKDIKEDLKRCKEKRIREIIDSNSNMKILKQNLTL